VGLHSRSRSELESEMLSDMTWRPSSSSVSVFTCAIKIPVVFHFISPLIKVSSKWLSTLIPFYLILFYTLKHYEL
jgi:hypothetical protein